MLRNVLLNLNIHIQYKMLCRSVAIWDLSLKFSFFLLIVVISRPPMVRSFSYSASPSSLEQPSSGSLSPACKAVSGLDSNLGT